MFKPKVSTQNEFEFVTIDDLVPDNHLLRLIDKHIDFSFLLEKVRPYYSDDNGRPSDPLNLFKLMFIGYLYGIRSERQLQREIEVNVAYRWFLGLI
ncbi:transposase [Bacillus sp. MRMR6]|nr:transposase [Bacillus sp. MRMR6]